MNFVLAAGGTGGHMVPAHALAAELRSRGHGVLLITDDRGARFPGLFDKVPVQILPAGRLGGGPIGWMKAFGSVLAGRRAASGIYRNHPPNAVVGFGGYPALPSLLAASSAGIPSVLHEQNAVLGRANRFVAGRAAARSLSVGRPHAARELADLVERIASGLTPILVGSALEPRTRPAFAGGVPA
jgi:UDP-N-acetylglucosamine--N-acetylmuramyl-(pentapeptide) pyrophosphoryl-undecaprenol N-acetylglucosamine transferase